LRNESGSALTFETSKASGHVEERNRQPSRKLPPGQSVELPLATVVSRGLDLPFVLLGTNVATRETLVVRQDQAKQAKEFAFPFPQQTLTDRWSQQDYLGRFLTRNLGRMVIVDPAEESYWKRLGRTPVKLKVTQR
jgi:hypothetical protein